MWLGWGYVGEYDGVGEGVSVGIVGVFRGMGGSCQAGGGCVLGVCLTTGAAPPAWRRLLVEGQ